MNFVLQPWQFLAVTLAGWVHREQQQVIDFQAAEIRMLKQLLGQKRLLLNDRQRRLLAAKGKALGSKLLHQVATIVTPDTILRWHRELIAAKWDTSDRQSKPPGRPPTDPAIVELVLRFARENPSWGFDRIQGALANLGHDISDQTVGNILKEHGIEPAPERKKHTTWKAFLRAHWDQLASNSANGLPGGLAIDASTGLITGTISSNADASSPYTVTVSATDGTATSSQTFAWQVSHLAFTPAPDQANAVGDSVSLSVAARDNDGDHLTFQAVSLPEGLSIDSQTGLITGVVKLINSSDRVYFVTITVTDGSEQTEESFNWSVTHLALESPGDQVNAESDQVSLPIIAVTQPGASLNFTVQGLPPGLNIDPTTGTITGTLAVGTASSSPYVVTVTTTDGEGASASITFNWTVASLVVQNPGDQVYAEGDNVSLQILAYTNTGGALAFSADNLPPGLSINTSTGLISGTVAAGAASNSPYAVAVHVADAAGDAQVVFFQDNVQDYKATFSPDKIVTGFRSLVAVRGMKPVILPLTKPPVVTITVSDETRVKEIMPTVTGEGKDRIAIEQMKIDKNKITFQVNGKSATPANKKDGDTAIEAIDKGTKKAKGTAPVVVVVPVSIGVPHQEFKTGTKVKAVNVALNVKTSPALPEITEDKVYLGTSYHVNLTVQVLDQFKQPLSQVYAGEEVSETRMVNGVEMQVNINQKMSQKGTYVDPVGFFQEGKIVEAVAVIMGKRQPNPEIDKWLKAAVLALKKDKPDLQNIDVQIAGHELTPSPAVTNRTITPKAPDTIIVTWPNPDEKK